MAEVVAGWIQAVWITSRGQWALRVIAGMALGAAALLCRAWFPVAAAPALAWVLWALLALSLLWPDSPAPLGAVLTLVLWWLGGAADAPWWQGLTLAGLAAVFHVACGYAAAAPAFARVTARAGGRLVLAGLGYALVCVAVGAGVLGVAALPGTLVPRGFAWVAASVLALGVTAVVVVLLLRRPEED